MPTHITQNLDENAGKTIYKVKGEVLTEDAVLLERIVKDSLADGSVLVEVDLADIDFLDSESAPILKRISSDHRVSITGLDIFLQSAIDSVERTSIDRT